MEKNKRVPKIRFAGFTDEWEERKFSDTYDFLQNNTLSRAELNMQSGKVKNVHYGDVLIKFGEYTDVQNTELSFITDDRIADKYSSSKLQNGDIIIADTAEDDTVGKCTEIGNTGKISVVSGLHTMPCRPKEIFAEAYLGFYMNSNSYHDQLFPLMQGIKVTSISKSSIQETVIKYPKDKSEQQKIAAFFRKLDNLIILHQRKLDKLKNIKKSLLEKIFPKEGACVPEIRFAGFTDEWEQCKLGEVAPLRGGYAFKSNEYVSEGIPIIRISNVLSDGNVGAEFIYYTEQNNDISFVLKDGAALLAMSGATTGKVSILHTKSSDKFYQNQRVGYFEKTTDFDYSFVSTIVRSQLFIKQLSSVLVAGAQPNVSSKEIDSFEFLVPQEKEEQKRIGEVFTNLDNLINLHQRKLDKLKNIKKSCLESLFV